MYVHNIMTSLALDQSTILDLCPNRQYLTATLEGLFILASLWS